MAVQRGGLVLWLLAGSSAVHVTSRSQNMFVTLLAQGQKAVQQWHGCDYYTNNKVLQQYV